MGRGLDYLGEYGPLCQPWLSRQCLLPVDPLAILYRMIICYPRAVGLKIMERLCIERYLVANQKMGAYCHYDSTATYIFTHCQ